MATSIDAAEPDDAIVGGTLAYLPTADVARFAGLSSHGPTSRSFANVDSKSLAQEAARSAERADIFAIGVILHEVATGSLPFPPPVVDESIVAAAREALANRRDLPDRVRRNVNIPASLRAIIAGCFAEPEGESSSPAGHYESMLQLSEDLSAYINARPLLHAREGFAASAKRQLRRHRKALVTLASLALVLFASFVADRWMTYSEIQSVRDYAIEMVEASEVEERLPAGLSNSLFNSGYFPDSATLIQSRATACHEAGVAFLRRDRPAEAVRLLTLAHRMQPKNGECLNDLGAAQFNARDFAGAIDSFNMALKLPCDHAAVLSNRGAAFAAMNLPQQARGDFLKALKLVPDHREATFHLKLLEETMAPDSTSISTEHRPQRLPEYLSP